MNFREKAEDIAGSDKAYGWTKGCEMHIALSNAIEQALQEAYEKGLKDAKELSWQKWAELRSEYSDDDGSQTTRLRECFGAKEHAIRTVDAIESKLKEEK